MCRFKYLPHPLHYTRTCSYDICDWSNILFHFNQFYSKSVGFLIAGGWTNSDPQKVEIFRPELNKTCSLENLPDRKRYYVSMCGGLLCGGWGVPARDYCLKWDSETGTFSRTRVKRRIGSRGFSCWDLGDRGVLVMGYNNVGDRRTTDLVSVNGRTSSPSFTLKHKIR